MMLARYLHTRASRPVRYAMHPDLARALSNYLMIHSRANDLMGLHHQAGMALGLEGHPQLSHLMHGLLQGHHEAPGMYLDVMQELAPHLRVPSSATNPRTMSPVQQLLSRLDDMMPDVDRPARIGTGYSQRALQHPRTHDLLTDAWVGALPAQGYLPSEYAWQMRERAAQHGIPPDLAGYLRASDYGRDEHNSGGLLRHILTLHDLAGESSRRMEGGYPQSLHSGLTEALRDHLVPHLDEMNRGF